MKCGSLKYSTRTEEGCIYLSKEFLSEHPVIQMDIISDWIADLTQLYESTIEKYEAGFEKRRKDRLLEENTL